MKCLVENIITPEEAVGLTTRGGIHGDEPAVRKILKKIFEITGTDESAMPPEHFIYLEKTKPNGRGWHKDTGSNDHMTWCRFGASVLLTDNFDGGMLEYKDGTSLKHYLSLSLHSSDVEHRVTPVSKGRRVSLLFFI